MNTVNLIGRLTADPQLRNTNGGTPVCTLRLAVPRPPRDGSNQEATFVDVTTFARQAEAAAEHLAKGRQVAVTGRLDCREWTGEDGSPRSKHEVVAAQVDFLARPAGQNQPEATGEEDDL